VARARPRSTGNPIAHLLRAVMARSLLWVLATLGGFGATVNNARRLGKQARVLTQRVRHAGCAVGLREATTARRADWPGG